jgi:hypothetical protein
MARRGSQVSRQLPLAVSIALVMSVAIAAPARAAHAGNVVSWGDMGLAQVPSDLSNVIAVSVGIGALNDHVLALLPGEKIWELLEQFFVARPRSRSAAAASARVCPRVEGRPRRP